MSRTIVIVDQQESVVAALMAAFARAGYRARGAHTFREAIALMDLVDPAAAIVSRELGSFNGLHVVLRSAVKHPSAKVIVTGPADSSIEDEALSLGAAGYVPRPLDAETLVDEVNALFFDTLPPADMLPFRQLARISRPSLRQLR